jgi:hypothetical protein
MLGVWRSDHRMPHVGGVAAPAPPAATSPFPHPTATPKAMRGEQTCIAMGYFWELTAVSTILWDSLVLFERTGSGRTLPDIVG